MTHTPHIILAYNFHHTGAPRHMQPEWLADPMGFVERIAARYRDTRVALGSGLSVSLLARFPGGRGRGLAPRLAIGDLTPAQRREMKWLTGGQVYVSGGRDTTPASAAAWERIGCYPLVIEDAYQLKGRVRTLAARGFRPLIETVPMDNKDRMRASTRFDLDGLDPGDYGGASFRAKTVGRDVVKAHKLTPPPGWCLYAVVNSNDKITDKEIRWYLDHGYHLMMQGVGPRSREVAAVRAWREGR